MQRPSSIKLSYFDARGRAQHLRYYLTARDVVFEDHRVPLGVDFSAWFAIRHDRSVAGPFHKLPILHWNGRQLAETMVIHAFLHRALGDAERLSDEQNVRHQMLASSLYEDMMLPIGTLLWAEMAYAGVDLAGLMRRTFERLRGHLGALDRTLDEWAWLDAARRRDIMLADCLLWEELDVVQHVFGPLLVLDELPTLARCYADLPVRPLAAAWLARQPAPITARPQEATVIAALQALC